MSDQICLPIFKVISDFLVLFLTNQLPLNKRFKICFKSFLKSIPVQKTVSEVLKRGVLFILQFGRQANGGGPIASPASLHQQRY